MWFHDNVELLNRSKYHGLGTKILTIRVIQMMIGIYRIYYRVTVLAKEVIHVLLNMMYTTPITKCKSLRSREP